MASLDQLMNLNGAIGAFQFDPKGELIEHRIAENSGLDDRVMDLLAHVCVANMAIATMQARGWETTTNMSGFYPIQGFSLVGYDWTAIVNGEYGVIVPNDKADYEAAYSQLNS